MGNDKSIEVFGKLFIDGKSTSKVILSNLHIVPGDNSPSELFEININHAEINGGSLYSPTGNSIYGSLILRDSFLYEVNKDGFNRMYLWYPQKDSYIDRNVFYNSGYISTGHRDADVYIMNNYFFTEDFASEITGYAVENWAAYNESETILKYNTFANTSGVAVSLPPGYSSALLNATENYWSTTSEDVIKSMIYDKSDDLAISSEIEFKPYLDEPDDNTPTPN